MEKIMFKELNNCHLCPRDCGVNRNNGEKGICMEDSRLFVSRAALHYWEEPCISGEKGSGAVFFSGCNMHCIFCQNKDISNGNAGKEITVERLSDIFLELEEKGANNINLVTPTHYTYHIIEAIKQARDKGIKLPFVYNTSGYEKPETLDLLKGYVDVFLPDFKYISEETAFLYSKAKDYPEKALDAIRKMVEIAGECKFSENGLIKSGVIVRVLVLPGKTKEAIECIETLYKTFSDEIYISIMSQYTPVINDLPAGKEYNELKRTLTKREYEKVINKSLEIGIKNAFIQEGKVCLESFIPSFNNEGV